MNRPLLIFGFLIATLSAFGQNGSLKLTGGGVFATMPLPGQSGQTIQFNQSYIYGALLPKGAILSQSYSLVTGPVIGQPNYKLGVKFGPGGSFQSSDQNVFKTSPLCPCNFTNGVFVSAALTPYHLSDGTWIYILAGELTGSFTAKDGVPHSVRAFYTGTVDDQSGQFEVNAVGASGLDIIYQPN